MAVRGRVATRSWPSRLPFTLALLRVHLRSRGCARSLLDARGPRACRSRSHCCAFARVRVVVRPLLDARGPRACRSRSHCCAFARVRGVVRSFLDARGPSRLPFALALLRVRPRSRGCALVPRRSWPLALAVRARIAARSPAFAWLCALVAARSWPSRLPFAVALLRVRPHSLWVCALQWLRAH